MPRGPSYEPELEALIAEQEADQQGRYVFPERIVPRKTVLFPNLTLRQKAVFVLSFFLKQKEIAELLNISPDTVKEHLNKAREKQGK